MTSRPKSVSFVAISFGVIALTFTYCSWRRFTHFYFEHGLHHLIIGILLLALAISLFMVARGLLKLSPKSRVAGVFLASIVTLIYFYFFFTTKSIFANLKTLEAPELTGAITGMIAFPLWLLSPIFVLTRPANANAFNDHTVA